MSLLLQLLEGANVDASGSKTQAEGLMYARIFDLTILQEEWSTSTGEEEKDFVCSLHLIGRRLCVAKIRLRRSRLPQMCVDGRLAGCWHWWPVHSHFFGQVLPNSQDFLVVLNIFLTILT